MSDPHIQAAAEALSSGGSRATEPSGVDLVMHDAVVAVRAWLASVGMTTEYIRLLSGVVAAVSSSDVAHQWTQRTLEWGDAIEAVESQA